MSGFQWSRGMRIALALAVVVVAAGFVLVHPCASGGGMGATYRACKCRGIEWVTSDRTASDGPRRTTCLGWVTERSCYRTREGEEIPCAGR